MWTCCWTLAELLGRLTVKELTEELHIKQLPLGGLKADLVARLAPVMVNEQIFRVLCSVARLHEVAIPMEALRSDEVARTWVDDVIRAMTLLPF